MFSSYTDGYCWSISQDVNKMWINIFHSLFILHCHNSGSPMAVKCMAASSCQLHLERIHFGSFFSRWFARWLVGCPVLLFPAPLIHDSMAPMVQCIVAFSAVRRIPCRQLPDLLLCFRYVYFFLLIFLPFWNNSTLTTLSIANLLKTHSDTPTI